MQYGEKTTKNKKNYFNYQNDKKLCHALNIDADVVDDDNGKCDSFVISE